MITIFKDVLSTSTGFHREINEILTRIKVGKSKELIELIRKETDSEKRHLLKRKLPAICFSGVFNIRSDKSIISHSGFICLDFDKFENETILSEHRKKLISDKYTYSVFTSPSGNGLKVIVKIPPVIKDHRDYFKGLDIYYNSIYFDKSCINESRVCYESYDSKIYINNDSEVFKNKIQNEQLNVGSDSSVLPVKSENQIIQNLLTWFDKNYSMIEGSRNKNLFILASAFNDFGINKNEAEKILLTYTSTGIGEREIENLTNSAYKNFTNFGTKFFEDSYAKNKIEQKIRSGDDIKKIKQSFKDRSEDEIEEAIENIKDSISITEFWSYNKSGKVVLSHHKYKNFIEQNGYFKMYPAGSENFIFILIKENLISNTSTTHIKDFVLDYLYKHEGGLLPYDFMASQTRYFKEDYLSLIDTTHVALKEDTKDKCYLYFKNCAIEITKNGVKEIDYLELDGYIWDKHIINREYKKVDPTGCVFEKFIELVTGNDGERQMSLYSIIGYLLHSFKTGSDNKAIIFNDEIISENPNGGSGKGIICNALGQMKRMATLDGKQFDFNKSFPYQTVSADTQLLVFDDVKRNFAFENLFSLVTEGITLEKKNKDAIHLPVQKSPKILITTNYTIKGDGGSFERRKLEIELSSYFSANHTPYDEFGHMLFDEWKADEWMKFDNFMILCVQYYLSNGLKKYNTLNLETRKFINNTSFEFNEWVEQGNIPHNEMLIKREYYDKYLEEYEDHKKFMTQRLFHLWVDRYAKYKGLTISKSASNGVRYFQINEA